MVVALNFTADGHRPKHKLKTMQLDYPALQAVDLGLPSYQKYSNGPGLLNKYMMIEFWMQYAFGNSIYRDIFYANEHLQEDVRTRFKDRVNTAFLPKELQLKDSSQSIPSHSRLKDSDVTKRIHDVITDPQFSPLVATDEQLAGLPPTRVLITEFDVLRDVSFILVERLKRVAVEVEYSYLEGEQHGFINMDIDTDAHTMELTDFAVFYNRTVLVHQDQPKNNTLKPVD